MMMRFVKRKKGLTALVALVVVCVAAAGAYAFWSASGSGTANATAGHAAPLTTGSPAVATSFLYPGGTADVKVNVVNPNPYPVLVTDVVQTALSSITSGDSTCDASNGVTFTAAHSLTGPDYTIPANGNADIVLPDAAAMSNASVDACQDKTFSIPVDLTGQSAA